MQHLCGLILSLGRAEPPHLYPSSSALQVLRAVVVVVPLDRQVLIWQHGVDSHVPLMLFRCSPLLHAGQILFVLVIIKVHGILKIVLAAVKCLFGISVMVEVGCCQKTLILIVQSWANRRCKGVLLPLI
jgi:hypothetical protein